MSQDRTQLCLLGVQVTLDVVVYALGGHDVMMSLLLSSTRGPPSIPVSDHTPRLTITILEH